MSEPPREHDVAVASTTVHVREWGPIDGPPLLFWHGLGSYTGLYVAEVAEALGRDHGLRVIAIDPPGVGRSPALPAEAYRPPELARRAAGLLEAMAIERCVFMGHSWGGLVGCHLAAEQPALVAALVLLDGGYEDSDVTGPGSGRALDDEVAAARGQQRSFDSWDALGEFLREHFPDLTPTAEAAWRAGHVERDGRVVDTMSPETVGAAAHGVRHAPAAATHAAIAASGLRVLLLVGGRGLDDVRRAALRRFSASLPAADVRVLADSSGDLVADLGPRLARLVGDWLSGGWYDRISAEGMLDVLAPYQPVVVGAHPLGLAAADTPVEVVCRATDLPAFARTVERAFGRRHGFALHGGSLDGEEAVFAEFDVSGLPVQLSAQAEHVHRRLGAATLGLDRALSQAPAVTRARLAEAVAGGEDWLEAAIRQTGLSRVALESLSTANPSLARQVMGRPQPRIPLREYALPVLAGTVAMGLIVVASLARGNPGLIGIMFVLEAALLGGIWGARLGVVAALVPLALIGLDLVGSVVVGSERCSPGCGQQVADGLFVGVLVASAAGVTGLVRDRYFPRSRGA